MARLQRRRFSQPVEVRRYPHGYTEVVELENVVVGRVVEQPGWRWSVDVKPIAGTDWCQLHHMGYALEGRIHVETPDGTALELGPGDVFEIPPEHDAWVIGEEPWVAVEFAGIRSYASAGDERGERVLVALLFTDIVDSTAMAARLGDRRWRELIGRHNEVCQAVLERHRGRLVKWTGDGMVALFDAAERAVRAADSLRTRLAELDLRVRAGIHSGEVELFPDDVRGLAVHAAARVMALAGPDEILVSSAVQEILDGSGFALEDRGAHEMKGLAGKRQVFAVSGSAATR